MYLKRLEMTGFKSFADRTELEFVPGVTAVVGPNGSGKSNVTDGIRWVLGEQSAKSLRGNKMEDVIFAGSDSRKPAGYCEVSMTFDNAERRLPVDYAEVTVTRRVYRSGESEYFLNKQSCRLKDIHELFMDTGIGKDAYSMIGQGKIDEILSSKSEDRRAIFEEAAGIVKYKARKKEAEKKLETTEQNLSRIHDLIHELKGQVEPLSEQAEKASQYKELKAELQEVEIGLYVHKIEALHEEWQAASQEVKTLSNEQISLASAVSSREAQLEELKAKLHEQEQKWEQVQTALLSVSEELEKAEGQRDVQLERVKNRTETQQQLSERINELEAEVARLTEEEERVRSLLAQKREELGAVEQELQKLELQLSLTSDTEAEQLQEMTSRVQQHSNQLVALRSEKQYATEQLTELSERLTHLAEERQTLQQAQEAQMGRANEIARELREVEEELRQAAEQVRQLAERRGEIEQAEKSLGEQSRKVEQQLNRLRSQVEWIKETEAEHQGFIQGVKEVLKARDRGVLSLAGIHGAVAQLIQVPEALEAAMETALGGALQHVVVEDEQTGRHGIQYLKEKRLGRATFLPLDVLKRRALPQQERAKCESHPGFVGVASDLVKTEPRYRHLVENMLGLVLVTENLEQANRLARSLAYRYRVVTLDGDVVNPGGSMTGGSRQKTKSNLLGRSRQLEECEAELKRMEQAWHQVEEEFQALNRRKQTVEQEWEDLRVRGEERRLKEQELRGKERELQVEERTLREQLRSLDREEEKSSRRMAELQEQLAQVEEKISELEREMELLQSLISQSQERVKQQADVKEEVGAQMTELKVQVARLHQEVTHLEENLARIGQERSRQEKQKQLVQTELHNLNEARESNTLEMQTLEERIAELRAKKEEVQQRLNETRSLREELLLEREAQEKEVRLTQQKLRKQGNRLHEQEVRANRLDVELNHQLQKLAEEYEMSYERAKQIYSVPEDPAQAERRVRTLKGKISGLGEVNLGAIEEYTRLTERLQFLQEQEADLLEAKQKLYEIISQLVEEMGHRFQEAFDMIRAEFQHVFVEMFGGGRADLKLSEPDNLLETGIEIVAQPPGKKLQNLNLLSGGERALAALALLYSVLRIKPVPFCVLDEVDAALDEANLTRYTRYMREFSNQTQFIIITHRKHTMEACDVLYGITMQESGISKLVSVKLEEYDGHSEVAASQS